MPDKNSIHTKVFWCCTKLAISGPARRIIGKISQFLAKIKVTWNIWYSYSLSYIFYEYVTGIISDFQFVFALQEKGRSSYHHLHNLELPKYSYGIVSKNYLLPQYFFATTTPCFMLTKKKQIFVRTGFESAFFRKHFQYWIKQMSKALIILHFPPYNRYCLHLCIKINASILVPKQGFLC